MSRFCCRLGLRSVRAFAGFAEVAYPAGDFFRDAMLHYSTMSNDWLS